MDNKSKLSELISQFEKNIDYYKKSQYNESSCRLEFIDKLLICLDWDVNNSQGKNPKMREVIVENYFKETGKPDYSMTVNGFTKYFVEAKKPNVNIKKDKDSVFQARSYGWSAKHPIVVLTNFEYLLIYDTTVKPDYEDKLNVALLYECKYSDYLTNYEDIYNIISKKAIYSGNFREMFALDVEHKQQIDEIFLEEINNWRLELGKILNTEGHSISKINKMIQKFINQIIFLRICEDRNLSVYKRLKDIKDGDRIIEELIILLKKADKKYNSGLFKDENILKHLDKKIINKILSTLYFPQSPYSFSVIESNILGQIYEMYLLKELILDVDGNIILSEKKQNLNRSIVSTPIEIVSYMVDKTLNLKLDNCNPEDVKLLKFSDISCGSGVFLTEIYQNLIEFCVEWYRKNGQEDKLVRLENGCYKLNFDEKKELLTKCIYGIDIDFYAVEVAKFSLLLKLLEDETFSTIEEEKKILPDLSENILLGNSLIDFSMIEKKMEIEKLIEICPFDWKNSKGEDLNFDLIIGNPPYVKKADIIRLLPIEEVENYEKFYHSAFQQYDKYYLFIERALEKINNNGLICLIVPNKFSNIKAGKKIREIITTGNFLKEYVDFGANQLFEGKLIYNSIVLLQKNKQEEFILKEISDIEDWYLSYDENVPTVKILSDKISEKPWELSTKNNFFELLESMNRNSLPLSKVAELFNGIQTSAERPPVYWFSEKEIIAENESFYEIKKFDKNYKIEKKILKPYFKPIKKSEKNLYSFDILKTNKWIIFPYENGKIIEYEKMIKEYPNTMFYLEEQRNKLYPRQLSINKKGRDVPLATENTWYQYGRDQALKCFENTPKLIVGIMRKDKPMYIYDENNLVISSGGTAGYCGIKEKEGSIYKLEFLQAYLSHSKIQDLISVMGSDFDGGFKSNGTSVLKRIPVKKINLDDFKQKILYNKIIEHVTQVNQLNKKLKDNLNEKENIVITRQKNRLIEEINKVLDQIFDL